MEDRLSSLPDALIAKILSLIPFNTAIQTSFLSNRWNRLWTGVTSFVYTTNKPEAPKTVALIMDNILPKLTSEKLQYFVFISMRSTSNLTELNAAERYFLDILRRSVEHLVFKVGSRCFFRVPSCVFTSQHLVVLELFGRLKLDAPGNVAAIHPPCLKRLSLECLLDVHPCLAGSLFQSCPLLEHLHLGFSLMHETKQHTVHSPVNILAPNLKSLGIHVYSFTHLPRMTISIDAPKLVDVDIHDGYSYYYWIRNPTSSVDVRIDLTGMVRHLTALQDLEGLESLDPATWMQAIADNDRTVGQMSKFVAGMTSNVRKLELHLLWDTNILIYHRSVDIPITFSKLVYLDIYLYGNVLHSFEGLLFSLDSFPNLQQFAVSLKRTDLDYGNMRWIVPASVPKCFKSTLKFITLWGIDGTKFDLKLVAYLLSKAVSVNQILIGFSLRNFQLNANVLWKEYQFIKSVLELPKISSTCKVLVSGRFTSASGDAFQYGSPYCKVYLPH